MILFADKPASQENPDLTSAPVTTSSDDNGAQNAAAAAAGMLSPQSMSVVLKLMRILASKNELLL